MSEFKQGDMILVGQNNPKEREFVAMDGSGYVCRGETGTSYFLWHYAKPLPTKPEPIPYNHETWPKQVVHLRLKEHPANEYMVIGLNFYGALTVAEKYTWDALFDYHEMSLDHCQTWQPCHYVPESE